MSDRFSRPVLALAALGLAGFSPARAEMKVTNTVPLPDLDRFANVLTLANTQACFGKARRAAYGEAEVANGLYSCSIEQNFNRVQVWAGDAERRAHPGQPDLTLIVDPEKRTIMTLVAAPVPVLVPAAAGGEDGMAGTVPARKTTVSASTDAEFRAAVPKMAKALSAMEVSH